MSEKPDYISATRVRQFLFCPLSYKYIYVDGVSRDDGDPQGKIYLIFGEAVHAALEENYRQKITTRKDLDAKIVVESFKREFFQGTKDIGIKESNMPSYAKPSDMALAGENMLYQYMEEKAPTIQPLYVEHEFTIPLKNYNVVLHGFIDVIDENFIIRDHKTVGKSTFKDWTQEAVDESVQLTIYAAAFRKLFGKKEGGVCIDLLPRMPKPEFKSIYAERTQDQILSVLDLAERISYVTEHDAFYANLGNCRDCIFKDTCPKRVKV